MIGADPRTDLALIKVDGRSDFPHVKLAEVAPRIGDWVVAVGNPFGLGGTVTAGIVSARGRDIGSGPYDDFIQIDAPVNKGNSGGPTFDMEGNVIEVNTAIFSPSGGSVGIAFDIPAETVKTMVAQLKDKGFVSRGWIGVQIQPLTAEIAEGLGIKGSEGALVDEAWHGAWLFPENPLCPIPCFRSRIHPVHSRGVGMHGARGGAPEGERNGNYRHGARTKEANELRKLIRRLGSL